MPQMFPLLWFILFISSSLALSAAMSNIFFQGKSTHTNLSSTSSQPTHTWKW